jgi:cytidylate kinase
MIIAVDGPAGAGKSTVARLLAKSMRFLYIDTGAMYRALTLKALDSRIDINDEAGLIQMAKDSHIFLKNRTDGSAEVYLDNNDVTSAIREPRITQLVSDLAKVKGIREVMLKLQRELAHREDTVLEGRDIGTVVFPDADVKFYLDAEFKQRVMRRYKELEEKELDITPKDVEGDILNRDRIDSTREHAPLKQAPDAVYIDTTHLTIREVVEVMRRHIPKLSNQKETGLPDD